MKSDNPVKEAISKHKVFAIIRDVSSDDIEDVVNALIEGGIRLLEVTFEHSGPMANTLKCVEIITQKFSKDVICGVGTAITNEQIVAASKAGAQFVVSPNTDADIIRLTKQLGLVSIPGALTPTEAVIADQAGADYVKLFPGGLFGIQYFKAVSEVLKGVQLIAVGGIDADNARAFLNAGAVGLGIGGYLVNAKKLKLESLENLTGRARLLASTIK